MARGMQTRKRSRPSSFSNKRIVKRRRTIRRGRKTNAFTSQSGTGGGLRFKARRTSRSHYRKLLWDSSTMLPKYRSLLSNNVTFNTPASINSQTVSVLPALHLGGNVFWTVAGGAVTPDAANALPSFTGNIILRGGKIGLRLTNTFDTTDANRSSMSGTIMLIRTSDSYVAANIPALVNLGWDTSYVQDFVHKVGRIVYQKNFLLRDADVANVEYRLKVTSIDQTDYLSDQRQYIWIVLAGNVDVASARSVNATQFYNISFTGQTV